jgi:hypothetical protein
VTGGVPEFRRPSRLERLFNRLFGAMVAFGLGARHNPRGRTEWVRNAETAGRLVLRRGSRRDTVRLRVVGHEEKPDILQAYLDRFRLTVQRYFPLSAGGESRRFLAVADRYPVFELLHDRD